MKTNKLLAVFLSVLLISLTGCGDRPVDTKRIESGKLKHELFKDCMNLASKNPRKGDDDVSDIVDECDSYAYRTSRQIIDA